GRLVFAAAIAAFGLLALGHAVAPQLPQLTAPWPATGSTPNAALNPTMPGGVAGAIFLGALLLALALGIEVDRWAPRSALALAAVAVLTAAVAWFPKLYAAAKQPIVLGPPCELLAMAGAALALAGALAGDRTSGYGRAPAPATLLRSGRLLFAATLPLFAALHFFYAAPFAKLIPAWIPFPLFWIYFFAVAMIAAAVSLVTGIAARLAATLLALMFGLWVVALHLPRCLHHPNGDEWTSLLVALAFAGSSAIMAATTAADISPRPATKP
ncbi:MAG TPA: hypothetical protein VGE98_15930, partial [Thermoanaerobaculia bacterium]